MFTPEIMFHMLGAFGLGFFIGVGAGILMFKAIREELKEERSK